MLFYSAQVVPDTEPAFNLPQPGRIRADLKKSPVQGILRLFSRNASDRSARWGQGRVQGSRVGEKHGFCSFCTCLP